MTGKTIVVSGASSGLGKEIATRLSGNELYLLSRTKPEVEPSRWIPCDIAKKTDVLHAGTQLPATIDVFIHCAGVGIAKEFQDITDEDIEELVSVNVTGSLYLTRDVYRRMIAAKHGHIVTVVSTSGKKPREKEVLYCASKFAQAGMSEALHLEGMKHNVKVTTVYPGGMKTNFYRNEPSRDIHTFMDPGYVAKTILSVLETDEAGAISQLTIERTK